jgi:hypothetical protein
MTHTITGTFNTLVSLDTGTYNPTTITGVLTDGLSVSYTGLGVINAGSIDAGSYHFGIDFLTAGRVTNQSGGAIRGGNYGIVGYNAAVTTATPFPKSGIAADTAPATLKL